MTPQELAEFRELAGLNEPNGIEAQKEWADAQITNVPVVPNQIPVPTIEQFGNPTIHGQTYGGNSGVDRELEQLSNRLNGLLGSDFKVERLN